MLAILEELTSQFDLAGVSIPRGLVPKVPVLMVPVPMVPKVQLTAKTEQLLGLAMLELTRLTRLGLARLARLGLTKLVLARLTMLGLQVLLPKLAVPATALLLLGLVQLQSRGFGFPVLRHWQSTPTRLAIQAIVEV